MEFDLNDMEENIFNAQMIILKSKGYKESELTKAVALFKALAYKYDTEETNNIILELFGAYLLAKPSNCRKLAEKLIESDNDHRVKSVQREIDSLLNK